MRVEQRGFTLLEIMIVLALIGILLGFGIPVYQDYAARTKVAECLVQQEPVKVTISEFAIDNRRMPAVDEVTVNRTTTYCDPAVYRRDSDTVATVLINVDEAAAGIGDGIVEPRLEARLCGNDDVEWSCYYASSGGDTTQGRYLPVSCRTTSVEFSESCAF